MNIVVTGGASGLGEAITRRLAASQDNTVYFTYYRSAEKAEQLAKELPNTRPVHVDFGNEESLSAFVSGLKETGIDVLVNNAVSGYKKAHFHKIPADYFAESFLQNVAPTIKISQEAIKIFRKRNFGKIITILTSGLINTPPIGWSEYTANKAYLLSLCKSWAIENNAYGISSNAISPSLMQTNLTSDMDERVVEMAVEAHPLKALLKTDEVAEVVEFFTKASQQLNGIHLPINAAVNIH
jgi:NAD(P)-dependent dehydrogenase (short-subunit alcohol dehydrogenase family)